MVSVVDGEEGSAVVHAHAHRRRAGIRARARSHIGTVRARVLTPCVRGGGVAQRLVHDLQHGHAERAGLSAARLRRREHVAPAEDQRHRLGLHRGGQEPSRLVGGPDQLGAHAHLLERRHAR